MPDTESLDVPPGQWTPAADTPAQQQPPRQARASSKVVLEIDCAGPPRGVKRLELDEGLSLEDLLRHPEVRGARDERGVLKVRSCMSAELRASSRASAIKALPPPLLGLTLGDRAPAAAASAARPR